MEQLQQKMTALQDKMKFEIGGSSSTISRVFVTWMVFLRCVFDEV